MRKQEGCRPWGGGTQRSFYFCLKVTIISNRGAALATRVLSPLNCFSFALLLQTYCPLVFHSCLGFFFFFFSPSSVSHSLLCSDVSFTTDWGTCVSLLFSWIMHINSRGQTEWVFRDNDWSDGTWAPLDCAASELVIKRQGRRGEGGVGWAIIASFKRYECGQKQCQTGPVLVLTLHLHRYIQHQQHIYHFPLPSAERRPQVQA